MYFERGLRSLLNMNTPHRFHWLLIAGLGVLALIRPLTRIIVEQSGWQMHGLTVLLLTVAVSAAWILIVGFSRVSSPVLTLVFAGIAYAVFAIILSALLSPVLDGSLQGPLANPIAIVPMLAFNAFWGLITGLIAMLIQRTRGVGTAEARR